jgi:cation diffusion facilitator family transporter
MLDSDAQKEKNKVAGNSVLAAVGLTAFKLVVGILTNSLGILAEAAHSSLDLVAALVTWFAVQISGKPADQNHQFGHGKVENLSALFETLLLLLTSAWIIYEAIQRMFYKSEEVIVTGWSFIVMATSIIVDINRSKMLYRAARKYNSQALEADALHFSTDIWSSSVVIIGLMGVLIADFIPGLKWLAMADAIAAIIVAVIVVYVSGELGWRTIKALLDTAPDGKRKQIIKLVENLDGVENCHAVRIRSAGHNWFIDLHIKMDGECTVNEAHATTELIEKEIQKILPGSDATIHVEPLEMSNTKIP